MSTTRPPTDAVEALTRQDIVARLVAPFAADQIQTTTKYLPNNNGGTDAKSFPNVAPHHFIKSLLEDLGGYVNFELAGATQYIYDKVSGDLAVIAQPYRLRFTHPNFQGVFEGVGAEETQPKYTQLAWSIKSAVSDGLKLAAKAAGKGLHIYTDAPFNNDTYNAQPPSYGNVQNPPAVQQPPPQPAPPPQYQQPAPQPQAQQQQYSAPQTQAPAGNDHTPVGDPNHGSTEPVGFGAHKDEQTNQVISSYLKWAAGEPTINQDANAPGGIAITFGPKGPDKLSDKRLVQLRTEVARRIRNGTWDPKEGDTKRGNGNFTDRSGGGRSGSALPAPPPAY